MEPKVSIIIPVYNVEKYLRRCLDSVLCQTFRDIEVILIDDGSPDSCGRICDEYGAADDRVKVIHQANSGVSCARNSGLAAAAGKYIGFVDPDDCIAPCMFEALYNLAEEADADIAMCQFVGFTADEGHPRYGEIREDRKSIELNRINAFQVILDPRNKISIGIWNKIFKRELLQNVRFDPGMRIAQDAVFLVKALPKIEKAVYLPVALYGYFAQRPDASTSYALKDPGRFIELYRNIAFSADDLAKTHPELSDIAAAFRCIYGDLMAAGSLIRIGYSDEDVMEMLRSDIRKNFISFLRSKISIMKKIQAAVFLISPGLYRVLFCALKVKSLER